VATVLEARARRDQPAHLFFNAGDPCPRLALLARGDLFDSLRSGAGMKDPRG
jgi:hypothetical protein